MSEVEEDEVNEALAGYVGEQDPCHNSRQNNAIRKGKNVSHLPRSVEVGFGSDHNNYIGIKRPLAQNKPPSLPFYLAQSTIYSPLQTRAPIT